MDQIQFGLELGWHLGNYDIMNGSPFVNAAVIDAKRNTLRVLLSSHNNGRLFDPDQRVLIENTLHYFLATNNIPTRNAILIGICASRAALIGASPNPESNQELTDLALSALEDVDSSMIGDRVHFFEQLRQANPGNITGLVDFLRSIGIITA